MAKSTRFLIDSIDRQLGSKEKEIKFDKMAIAISIVITTICAVVVLIFDSLAPWLSVQRGKFQISYCQNNFVFR